MKIYLAGRYGRRAELTEFAKLLEGMGWEVTSRWLRGAHEMPEVASTDESFNTASNEDRAVMGERFAEEDYEDIEAADILIAFTEQPGRQKGRARGGRHVELGVALERFRAGSMHAPVVVGYRENVFCCLPDIHFYADRMEAIKHISLLVIEDYAENMAEEVAE